MAKVQSNAASGQKFTKYCYVPIGGANANGPEAIRGEALLEPADAQAVDLAIRARLAQLERLAVRLDSQYRFPGTQIRFGLDPVLGLVPAVGDVCMAAIGMRIIVEARKMGVPQPLLIRMIGNTSLDLLIGIVPIAGPIVDAFYRTNERNLHLLLEHLARRDPVS